VNGYPGYSIRTSHGVSLESNPPGRPGLPGASLELLAAPAAISVEDVGPRVRTSWS